MDKLLLLFLISTMFTTIFGISIQQSEFCSQKNCTCDDEKLIVTCTGNKFNKPINSSEFWVNKENNSELYPFYKVSIIMCDIGALNQFPNSSISVFNLSMNRIEYFDNAVFQNFQNMSILDLSDNDLQSELLLPNVFQGLYSEGQYLPLKSLKVLNLANNGLHTLHQDLFEHIMELQVLDLHGNPLRVLDSQTVIAISGLMNLRDLDLSYTYLKKIPEHVFHTPKKLEKLNLAGNMLKVIPTAQLEDAMNLQYLNLNENPIENITKQIGFPKLDKLKILHLCYMDQLETIEDGSMSGLSNVEQLYISNNRKLRKIGELALARVEAGTESKVWPKVTTLHLNANSLTHLSKSFLADWDRITELDINDNPWVCDCENQWMINELVAMMLDEKKIDHRGLRLHCDAPPELKSKNIVEIYQLPTLRCLTTDGSQPEKDAGILIGILIGLLLGIPMVLGILFCYKKNWFGVFNAGPAAFSRKFYNPATTDDEFA